MEYDGCFFYDKCQVVSLLPAILLDNNIWQVLSIRPERPRDTAELITPLRFFNPWVSSLMESLLVARLFAIAINDHEMAFVAEIPLAWQDTVILI